MPKKKPPTVLDAPTKDPVKLIQSSSSTLPVAEFWLNGRGLGKARPRKTSRHEKMHLPEKYVAWLDNAIVDLTIQMRYAAPAPKPARIECNLVNFLSSDWDNVVGAVQDAMVQAGYLEGDSSSFVPAGEGSFAKIRKLRGEPKRVGILVKVYQGEILELDPKLLDPFLQNFPELFEGDIFESPDQEDEENQAIPGLVQNKKAIARLRKKQKASRIKTQTILESLQS